MDEEFYGLFKMADIKSLEHPTLKVPYEILNKKFRNTQKNIDREISHIQSASAEIEKCITKENVRARDISSLLGGMAEKLQVLKRKADEGISEELSSSNTCKKRLDHLKEQAEAVTSPNVSIGVLNQWRRKRLDRMVVEYFLRNGYYNAAITLADRSGIKDLTNIDIFLTSREVEKSLANHETSKCLMWCHDNKSKLRKLKSNMEFNIRIQEFVELIRGDKRMDAIKHARKHFPNFQDEHLQQIKQVMALLVFPVDTQLSPYKLLFDISRWDTLIEEFRQENYRLFQLASQSVFTVALQAGLSALKTPQCYSEDETRNPSCPVCQEDLNQLAQPLPFAHCSQSRLYCHISGLPLNENNQPMMLPNGYVYGEQVLLTTVVLDSFNHRFREESAMKAVSSTEPSNTHYKVEMSIGKPLPATPTSVGNFNRLPSRGKMKPPSVTETVLQELPEEKKAQYDERKYFKQYLGPFEFIDFGSASKLPLRKKREMFQILTNCIVY